MEEHIPNPESDCFEALTRVCFWVLGIWLFASQLPDSRSGTGIFRTRPGCRQQAAQLSAQPYGYCHYLSCSCYYYHYFQNTVL